MTTDRGFLLLPPIGMHDRNAETPRQLMLATGDLEVEFFRRGEVAHIRIVNPHTPRDLLERPVRPEDEERWPRELAAFRRGT